MRVLLAEDDENIRSILKLILERMGGHEVVVAVDGDQALYKALSLPFDVILLDGMMPKRSGLQVFRELRQQKPNHAPVIFLSAKTDQTEVEEFKSHGAGYLQKPFDPLTICEKIEEILLSLPPKEGAA
jgi:DNA-binding response OmpR family regulator